MYHLNTVFGIESPLKKLLADLLSKYVSVFKPASAGILYRACFPVWGLQESDIETPCALSKMS